MKWIDSDGFARADAADCEGGYEPIICFVCGGDGVVDIQETEDTYSVKKCEECDGDGVVIVRPYAREERSFSAIR